MKTKGEAFRKNGEIEQVNEGQHKGNFSLLYFQGAMKSINLEVVASDMSKKLTKRMIKGHFITRFGYEYKVFLELTVISINVSSCCLSV